MFKAILFPSAKAIVLVPFLLGLVPVPDPPRAADELPSAFKPIELSRTTKLVRVMGSQAWKHGGLVKAVALSPDGKRGVSGGLDGAVQLWDLATGECTRTLAARGAWVEDLAFFPDGKRVFVARVNGRLEIINVANGVAVQSIEGPQGLRRAALFPDGKRIAATPYKYPVSIFNVADGMLLAMLGASEGEQQISSLAVSPDGKRVLVGIGKTLDVFDVDSGKRLRSIGGFKDYVASIAVARDGKKCLAGSGDGTVRVLDLETGEAIRVIKAHTIRVEAVGFTHGEKRAFTGSDDYSFALFNLSDGKEVWRKQGPAVRCVAVTPDGKGAFTGSIHHGVMLWNLETGAPRGTISGHAMEVTSLAFAGDQTVTGSSDGTIRLWDANGREVKKLVRGYGGAQFVAAQNANVLAIGGPRGIAQVDLRTGDEKAIKGSENAGIWMGADGKTIVGISNRILKEWNLATGAGPRELATLPNSPNFAVAVEPRAKAAVVFSGDARTGALELWDLATGKATKTLETTGVNGFAHPLSISADGTRALAAHSRLGGMQGSELVLWDLVAGTPVQRFAGHDGRVVAACLSADGKRVISASEDRKVRIFGVDSPDSLDQIDLGAVGDSPGALALSKDGRSLLVGTRRGVALRFELR